MNKRIYIVLMLCLLFTSINIEAQKNPFGNGLYWELSASGVLTISGNGEMPNFEWEKSPFSEMIDQGKVSKIVIGEGITSVGDHAFSWSNLSFDEASKNRKKVKEVILPSTLERIGESAFSALYELKHITLGNRVKVIGDNAFFATDLTELEIPSSVQTIGEFAFYNCEIRNLNIPGTITSIGESAFTNNRTEILNIADGVKNINKNAFITRGELYKGEIHSLPAYINVTNCTDYGISKESVMAYRNSTWDEGSRNIRAKGGYSSVMVMKNGSRKCYKVSKDGRYGLTDAEGRLIVPTELEALEDAEMGYLKFKLNGFWGLMDYAGKIIIDTSRGYTSIGNFISFTKRFPYTMTGYKGECDLTGKEISKIKVATPQQSTASNSSNSSSSASSSSSNSGTQTIIVEQHGPVQVWVQCITCYGSGSCHLCNGSGWDKHAYANGRYTRCISCGGNGRCSYCSGRGGRYETQYR